MARTGGALDVSTTAQRSAGGCDAVTARHVNCSDAGVGVWGAVECIRSVRTLLLTT